MPLHNIPCLRRQSPYFLGLYLCTDQNLDRDCSVPAFPLSKTKDDQLFGQRQRDVDLKAPSVGFAAERETRWTLWNGCVRRKRLYVGFQRGIPDELAGSVTQGPKHIKIQPPHVVSGSQVSPKVPLRIKSVAKLGATRSFDKRF